MANRRFDQFPKTLEHEVVKLFAEVTFGAAGAPTLVRGLGVKSVTRTDTGDYTFVFGTSAPAKVDEYTDLLGFSGSPVESTGLKNWIVADPDVSAGELDVTCGGATPVDPDDGQRAFFEFTLSNTNVGA